MINSRQTILLLVLGVSIQLLAGCAGFGNHLEPPRISLADMRPEEFTGLETVFRVQLRVFNTNDMELNVKGIEADLEINGNPFATGVSKAETTIPAFESALVPVTVYSSVIDIFKCPGITKNRAVDLPPKRQTLALRRACDHLQPAV